MQVEALQLVRSGARAEYGTNCSSFVCLTNYRLHLDVQKQKVTVAGQLTGTAEEIARERDELRRALT